MEELVQSILKFIRERNSKRIILSIDEFASFDESQMKKIFLYHKMIVLTKVNIVFLRQIVSDDSSNLLIKKILTGYDFGCEYQFHLSFEAYQLLPMQIFKWPVKLISKGGHTISFLDQQVLSYKDIVSLEDATILVKEKEQIITALATEMIAKKNIHLIER